MEFKAKYAKKKVFLCYYAQLPLMLYAQSLLISVSLSKIANEHLSYPKYRIKGLSM